MLFYFKHLPRIDYIRITNAVDLGQLLISSIVFGSNARQRIAALDSVCFGRCGSRPINFDHLAGIDQVRIVNPINGCKMLVGLSLIHI